ncbi:MAG: glycosyl transferase [Pirellula sp.]|nr:glycosyl transferase [Pirellula sp.]
MQPDNRFPQIGVVAIGRNEGERLRACLESVVGQVGAVVYVDSGSTDESVAMARSLGAEVVRLDLTRPFTAARARNAGLATLRSIAPGIEYVQFVDGDCEIRDGWLATALAALHSDERLAVVCGRRRERRPEASIYNRLCDLEWDTPVGEAKACGGDALMRAAALTEVVGYNESLIAGEEPELCVRLRARDWKVRRLAAEMTWHDAAMTRFGQWWRRTVRAGHAFAEGAALHGAPPERHWTREARSNWLWGLLLPTAAIAFAWPTHGASLLLFAGYLLLGWRVARYCLRRGYTLRDALLYSLFTVVGKFPAVIGQLQFHTNHWRGRRTRLIEYKGAAACS